MASSRLPKDIQCEAEIGVHVRKIRLEPDGLPIGCDSPVDLPVSLQDVPEIVVIHRVVRGNRDRSLDQIDSLARFAGLGGQNSQEMQSFRLIGPLRQDLPVYLLRLREPALPGDVPSRN